MSLRPPKGYDSWLDYAVANMPTRELFNRSIAQGEVVQREKMRDEAQAELDELRPIPKGEIGELLEGLEKAVKVHGDQAESADLIPQLRKAFATLQEENTDLRGIASGLFVPPKLLKILLPSSYFKRPETQYCYQCRHCGECFRSTEETDKCILPKCITTRTRKLLSVEGENRNENI